MKSYITSVTQGYFTIPSGVVVMNSDLSLVSKFSESHAKSIKEVASAPWNRIITFSNDGSLPQELLQSELTRLHEQAHYRQLMSTPLGLLLWRTYNALACDLEFIVRATTSVYPPLQINLPIDTWFAKNGLEQLSQAVLTGAEFNSHWPYKRWNDLKTTLPYLENLSIEVNLLQLFLSALLDRTSFTIGYFVDIANASFDVLQRRSDTSFKVRWATRLPLDTPLITNSRFSGTEMIEASARFEERLYLATLTDSTKQIEQWELKAIHGVYAPVYKWLLDQLGDDVEAALAILDTAFMTPIDPAFVGACEGDLFVEEILPSFRLEKLVEVALNDFWPCNPQELNDFLGCSLCERAGLLAPSKVVRQGLSTNHYSGEHSWDYDSHSIGRDIDIINLGVVYDYAQNEVRRAMSIRNNSASAFVREDYEKVGPFRPLLHFFTDTVIVGIDQEMDYGLTIELMLNSYWKFMSDGLLFSLLDEGDITELIRCEKVFKRRAAEGWLPNLLQQAPLNESEKQDFNEILLSLLSILPIARGLLDDQHLSLVGL